MASLQEMQHCVSTAFLTTSSLRALKQISLLLRGRARRAGEVQWHSFRGVYISSKIKILIVWTRGKNMSIKLSPKPLPLQSF